MADAWHGPTLGDDTLAFGPLTLIAPLLQRLDIAPLIDRHLPPDSQLAFPHGRVLSPLLAARRCQPTARINIPAWAERTGAVPLWDIPADSLNGHRLGRSLDAFFIQRHSVLAPWPPGPSPSPASPSTDSTSTPPTSSSAGPMSPRIVLVVRPPTGNSPDGAEGLPNFPDRRKERESPAVLLIHLFREPVARRSPGGRGSCRAGEAGRLGVMPPPGA
jgi:hypothetical protein